MYINSYMHGGIERGAFWARHTILIGGGSVGGGGGIVGVIDYSFARLDFCNWTKNSKLCVIKVEVLFISLASRHSAVVENISALPCVVECCCPTAVYFICV